MKEISRKRLKQKEEGITLVALIITIIILIILAAVTIKTVFGNNFIGIATKGTEDYAKAQIDESEGLDDIAKKVQDAVDEIGEIEDKPVEPTAVYVKAYQDGTLMFSSTDYVDKSRGTYVDYGDISEKEISSSPEWKNQNIKQVIVYDKVAPKSTKNWFRDCSSIESMDLSKLRTNNVTDMSSMFSDCSNLSSLDLSSFDTSNVTAVTCMLDLCYNLSRIYVKDEATKTKLSDGTGADASVFEIKST